jgi:tetratricopeptide (TPR) repeat protein
MTVVAALVLSLSMSAGQADPRQEAERLATSGAHEEALKRFQAIVAANPTDVDARLWIGRLHVAMNHPRRAAAVFESIVATHPDHVEALAGLGRALVQAGDLDRAAGVLDRAEALAGERADILAAQGHRHAATGHTTLALAYYDRVLAADPSNVEAQTAADALKASRAHRLALGYNFQTFDPSAGGDFNAGSLLVNARVSDFVRLVAMGELQRFRGTDEARGGGGVEWLVQPRLLVRGGGLFGGETWLPTVDAWGEATYSQRRTHWIVTLRFFDFDDAELWIGGPGLAFDVTPRVRLVGQYLRGRTELPDADSLTTDNWLFGLHASASERVRARIEYRRGIDRLDWLTADRLFADQADTLGVGASVSFTPFVGVAADYDYQQRTDRLDAHRARGQLTVRF